MGRTRGQRRGIISSRRLRTSRGPARPLRRYSAGRPGDSPRPGEYGAAWTAARGRVRGRSRGSRGGRAGPRLRTHKSAHCCFFFALQRPSLITRAGLFLIRVRISRSHRRLLLLSVRTQNPDFPRDAERRAFTRSGASSLALGRPAAWLLGFRIFLPAFRRRSSASLRRPTWSSTRPESGLQRSGCTRTRSAACYGRGTTLGWVEDSFSSSARWALRRAAAFRSRRCVRPCSYT